MPFFLKPCLKLRRKKNKRKQKSEETIKRVSDVTVPVTTEEIWRDCELSSSTSNVSGNADLTVTDVGINGTSVQPSSSLEEEPSINRTIVNENDEINNESSLIITSHENESVNTEERAGNVLSVNKNKTESETGSLTKETVEPLPIFSDTQVEHSDPEARSSNNDSQISSVSCNEDEFCESNNVKLSNNINETCVNSNVFRKIEELIHIRSSLSRGDQNSDEDVGQKNGEIKAYKMGSEDENNEDDEHLRHHDTPGGSSLDDDRTFDKTNGSKQISGECENTKSTTTPSYTNFRDDTDINTLSLEKNKNIQCGKISSTECISSKITNNLIESKGDVIEVPENNTQGITKDCLDEKRSLEVDCLTRGENQSTHQIPSNTNLRKCTESWSKDENTREEMYDYWKKNLGTGKGMPDISSLNETGFVKYNDKHSTELIFKESVSENKFMSDGDNLSKKSDSGLSVSSAHMENTDGKNNFSGNEVKDKDDGKDFGDFHQRDSMGGHSEESGENKLNFSQQYIEISNSYEGSVVKPEIEVNAKSLMNGEWERTGNANENDSLAFQEVHHRTLQMQEPNFPKFEEDDTENMDGENNEIADLRKSSSSKIIRKRRYWAETEEGCKQAAELPHLTNDSDDDDDKGENISLSDSRNNMNNGVDSSLNNIQYNLRNTLEKTEMINEINSHHENEINHLSEKLLSDEKLKNGEERFTVGYNTHLPTKIRNCYPDEINEPTINEKTFRENVGCKSGEYIARESEISVDSSNKIHPLSLTDILTEKEKSNTDRTFSPKKSSDLKSVNDKCQTSNSTCDINALDDTIHCQKRYCTCKSADKTHDFVKEEFNDIINSKIHGQVNTKWESWKSNELNDTKERRISEEYDNNSIDETYEKFFACEKTQSPKRLNRFSNISSASDSSKSSKFSDEGGKKEIPVKERESKSFFISGCGDSRNDERTDEASEFFKNLQKVNEELRRKENELPIETIENYLAKRKPKLTISITKRQNKDTISTSHKSEVNQLREALSSSKTIDSNEIDRRRESIEIFNRKIEQALSDMKSRIRIIPVQKAKTTEVNHLNAERISIQQKKTSPFLKFSLNSHRSEFERTLDEFMPESLLGVNKNIKLNQTLNPSNSGETSFEGENTDSIHSSDSETESTSEASEQMTPVRKRILDASREIRSPKYPFRTHQRTSYSNPHYFRRPVIIKSPKVNLVAYLTKDQKNVYQIRKGYRMYDPESGNFQIISPDKVECRQSDFRRHQTENPVHKRTTSPDYLKPMFDDTFKRYAKKGRSNGELISYKRSTEWLRDAGIIGKTLTAEEAINAFKCTAGVKVALNKGDYRHYLKKLARIKRLNYNELYKRLCSPANKYVE